MFSHLIRRHYRLIVFHFLGGDRRVSELRESDWMSDVDLQRRGIPSRKQRAHVKCAGMEASEAGRFVRVGLKDSASTDAILIEPGRWSGRRPRRTVTSDLVERARLGDHEAFEALVRPAYQRLYAVARRVSRDPYAAEDAVQDAIVRAWRDLRGLRDPERFEPWLYRLLINACRDQARRVQRRPVEVSILETDRADDDHATDLARRDQLERAFSRLSVDQRAVLVLTHYLGFSASEISAMLGVPTGTVYSRLHYSAVAMREALGEPAQAPRPSPEHVR